MEFRILGPVGLWSGGTQLPLRGSKQRTILAALLLADGWLVLDSELGDMLWGEDPPVTYQAQIYTYASRLRKQLNGAEIVRQGSGYLIRMGAARFDFGEFVEFSRAGRAALPADPGRASRLLRAGLDLWRGPTLADVTTSLAEIARPRIEMARMEALESMIDADLALGQHERVTGELTRLVGHYPMRERFRAQLMVALYRCDRQAEAFATYREGCLLLREELGVDPGPAVRSAYQAILTDHAS